MYHLASGWILHDIPNALQEEIKNISLRGYNPSFINLTGDFSWKSPLSVDDIASDICPVRKDLYNSKVRGLKGSKKNGRKTWGRLAGHLIEKYCSGLLSAFDDLYGKQRPVDYAALQRAVDLYSSSFFTGKEMQSTLARLRTAAAEEGLGPALPIEVMLQYSARNELAFLAADWALSRTDTEETGIRTWFKRGFRKPRFSKLSDRIPISVDKNGLSFHPNSATTGISDPATPDFLLQGANTVGDIKSGSQFKPSYQMTCTGYALARENQLGPSGDTNIGIIYFVETHGPSPVPARSYFFVISDRLRRAWADRRNRVFNLLGEWAISGQPPDISTVSEENNCRFCKFRDICKDDR